MCHFEHLGSLLIKPTRLMFIVAWNRHNHFPLARRRFGEEVCLRQRSMCRWMSVLGLVVQSLMMPRMDTIGSSYY